MAKFEEVWEHERVLIRWVDLRDHQGRSAARKDAGLVAKALESLQIAAAPRRNALAAEPHMHCDSARNRDGTLKNAAVVVRTAAVPKIARGPLSAAPGREWLTLPSR